MFPRYWYFADGPYVMQPTTTVCKRCGFKRMWRYLGRFWMVCYRCGNYVPAFPPK